MVSARKRGRHEMEAIEPPKELALLERIRNMWEFAALVQWIFIFGRAVKIDENLDIEVRSPTLLNSFSARLLGNVDSDDGILGSGDGMSQESLHCSTRNWSCTLEICIIAPRSHVRFPLFSSKSTHTFSGTRFSMSIREDSMSPKLQHEIPLGLRKSLKGLPNLIPSRR